MASLAEPIQNKANPNSAAADGCEAGRLERSPPVDPDPLLDLVAAPGRGQDDAERDDGEDRSRSRSELLPGQDRDDGGDGALGRGDGRDDADRPDPVRRVGKEEAADVGRAGERRQEQIRRCRGQGRDEEADRQHDHEPDEHRARHGDRSAHDPACPSRHEGRDGERGGGRKAGEDGDHDGARQPARKAGRGRA